MPSGGLDATTGVQRGNESRRIRREPGRALLAPDVRRPGASSPLSVAATARLRMAMRADGTRIADLQGLRGADGFRPRVTPAGGRHHPTRPAAPRTRKGRREEARPEIAGTTPTGPAYSRAVRRPSPPP